MRPEIEQAVAVLNRAIAVFVKHKAYHAQAQNALALVVEELNDRPKPVRKKPGR